MKSVLWGPKRRHERIFLLYKSMIAVKLIIPHEVLMYVMSYQIDDRRMKYTYNENKGIIMKLEKVRIEDLLLDLNNFRTQAQQNEKDAIDTMISTSPDNYWSLFTSILENGYFGVENIIVIRNNEKYIVKEGNRRVSVLKLIYGLVPDFVLEQFYLEKIKKLSKNWLDSNNILPCIVYESDEIDKINEQISLIHGKAEKASRDAWKAIAKARFARNINKKEELGLDLFDKYLNNNFEISDAQKKKWSGVFSITILDEVLPKISSFLNYSNIKQLIEDYPKRNKELIDSIIFDIGNGLLGFQDIRDISFLKDDKYAQLAEMNYATEAGFESEPDIKTENNSAKMKEETLKTYNSNNNEKQKNVKRKTCTSSLLDQRSVRQVLRKFKPHGKDTEKVVTLRDEMLQLDITKNPLAFCFLLRSMIEISLKVFSQNTPDSFSVEELSKKGKLYPRELSKIIEDAISFFVRKDSSNQKKLHPANVTLANDDSILSVTSLNQLIHNPRFSLSSADICSGFHNIFSLIELLNS